MNKVDKLEKEIREIREICDHTFEMTKEPTLVESLVKGVYLGKLDGPTKDIKGKFENVFMDNSFTLVCSLCSLERKCSAVMVCPKCYSKMNRDSSPTCSLDPNIWNPRIYYFGVEYIYYSVILSRCPNNDFTVASDEWDQ